MKHNIARGAAMLINNLLVKGRGTLSEACNLQVWESLTFTKINLSTILCRLYHIINPQCY